MKTSHDRLRERAETNMNEQRSSDGCAHGCESLSAHATVLVDASGVTQGYRSFLVARIDDSLYERSGNLHRLLIPVLSPIGELFRESGFLKVSMFGSIVEVDCGELRYRRHLHVGSPRSSGPGLDAVASRSEPVFLRGPGPLVARDGFGMTSRGLPKVENGRDAGMTNSSARMPPGTVHRLNLASDVTGDRQKLVYRRGCASTKNFSQAVQGDFELP